jgi:protein FAM50
LADKITDDLGQRKKFYKNPNVDTSFLPDRERDEQERVHREELRKDWLDAQERLKEETIEITYSFWDGSGHRKSVEVRGKADDGADRNSARKATILLLS